MDNRIGTRLLLIAFISDFQITPRLGLMDIAVKDATKSLEKLNKALNRIKKR